MLTLTADKTEGRGGQGTSKLHQRGQGIFYEAKGDDVGLYQHHEPRRKQDIITKFNGDCIDAISDRNLALEAVVVIEKFVLSPDTAGARNTAEPESDTNSIPRGNQ